jgi:hypothetical protein
LSIEHSFIRGDIERQLRLMPSTEGAQVGPKPGTSPFTSVAVHLTSAIVILSPFVHPMMDGRMEQMTAPITLPLVGIELGTVGWNVFGDEAEARPCVGVIAHPKAVLARLPQHDTDDGQVIVGIGAVPFAVIGPGAG